MLGYLTAGHNFDLCLLQKDTTLEWWTSRRPKTSRPRNADASEFGSYQWHTYRANRRFGDLQLNCPHALFVLQNTLEHGQHSPKFLFSCAFHFPIVDGLLLLPSKSRLIRGRVSKAIERVAPDLWYATSIKPRFVHCACTGICRYLAIRIWQVGLLLTAAPSCIQGQKCDIINSKAGQVIYISLW